MNPPNTPTTDEITDNRGIVSVIPHIFGTTMKRTGLRASVCKASTSSVTVIVAISAAMDDPDRPANRIAVINGPISLNMATTSPSAMNIFAPNCLRSPADCNTNTMPIRNAIRLTMGSDPTPMARACAVTAPLRCPSPRQSETIVQ